MVNYFYRGLRRIFGIKRKPKRRLAPYGSITRPKLFSEYVPEKQEVSEARIDFEEFIKKEAVKKKVTRKKAVKKVFKKKPLRGHSPTQSRSIKKVVKKKVVRKNKKLAG